MAIIRSKSGNRGFTLIEIVVVLLIFGIILAMAAAITRGVSAAQKSSLTATRIAGVDAALVNFVAQQRRLPCPADGKLAASANGAGVETGWAVGGCTIANMTDGVVPWRTLGLSETDATDGWYRRLTYRLDPLLAAAGGMDMSWCDPAGQEGPIPPVAPPRLCTPGCTSSNLAACTPPSAFLVTRGLLVKNNPVPPAAPTNLMDPAANPSSGAAYVVISHGESGGGGYLNTGQLGASTVGDGDEEQKNWASKPFVSTAVTYYVDDSISGVANATHFDDIVSRPSIITVITKAGLGPRAH